MSNIRKLPEHVINQIKAGEVIERPASVVKELVENAIDAQASMVTVEILDGGKELIRVTDNGLGMSRSELKKSVERHATSKLQSFEDLKSLSSFGFRGEALASIVAVSHLTLKSRKGNSEVGDEVTYLDGKLESEKEVSTNRGTQISVKDLFYSVPARRKFLKGTPTEFSHIQHYMISVAMAYPMVGFKLIHNSRLHLNLPKEQGGEARFRALLSDSKTPFFSFHYEKAGMQVHGFLGSPATARKVPQLFMTFVNGRYIKDKLVRSAVLQGYESYLLKGLTPSVVVFISMKPGWVDVNAHPAKIEVRFQDPAFIQEHIITAISSGIRRGLQEDMAGAQESGESDKKPAVSGGESYGEGRQKEILNVKKSFDRGPSASGGYPSAGASNVTEAIPVPGKARTTAQGRTPVSSPSAPGTPKRPTQQGAAGEKPFSLRKGASLADDPDKARRFKHMGSLKRSDTVITGGIAEKPSLPKETDSFFQEELSGPFSRASYLGQYRACYLLFEVDEELWVVDQHAFHERILMEEFMRADSGTAIPRQEFLTPIIVNLPQNTADIVLQYSEKMEKLGFQPEKLTEDSIAIHSIPSFLNQKKASVILDEICVRIFALEGLEEAQVHPLLAKIDVVKDELFQYSGQKSQLKYESVYHLFYSTAACHSAVRAGDVLNPEFVRRLLKRAGDVDFYAHCPHGRPVLRKFKEEDVASWFMRI